MSTTLDARPDGHGHVLAIGGRDIKFDSVWEGGGEETSDLVVWTHDMKDEDVVTHIRAYAEGPFARTYGSLGLVDEEWPGPDYVRRVWARWRAVTDDEARILGGDWKAGDLRWEERPEPGDGLQPACVVDLT